MKLVYVKWKDVRAFLRSMDEPVSSEFQIIIRTTWQSPPRSRWVYEVEIPPEIIT